MKRSFKILAGLIVFIFILGIGAFFIVPPLLKPVLVERLSQALHRNVSIEKISINPFHLSATVKGFVIREPSQTQPFVSFDELYVDAEGLSSLFKRALILQEIRLTRPSISIWRDAEGKYNFMDLIPKPQEKKADEKPFHFSLNNIRIINGNIDFDDRPMKIRHTVRDLNFSVPFVSNVSHYINRYIEPRFAATINGDRYELVGRTKPFAASRETVFDVEIREFDIPDYLNYLPVKLNFKLLSARLDTKLNVSFIMNEGKAPAIKVSGGATLSKVELDDLRKNKILRLPALEIGLASVEPLVPDIHLSKVSIKTPDLVIRKDKSGQINLLNLLSSPQEKTLDPDSKTGAGVDKKNHSAVPEKKTPLKLLIDDITIESGKATFIDLTPEESVKIEMTPLDLLIKNLSTVKGNSATVDLSLKVDNKGFIAAKGAVEIEPLHADLLLDVKNIGIRTFQPYFADKVKIDITRGAVSTAGRFTMSADSRGKPALGYSGKIAVSNLATRDKAFSNDFVNWKQLYFDQVEAGFSPLSLSIKGISLTDFYARIIINPDGTMNLQNILGGKPDAAQPAPKEAAPVQTGQAGPPQEGPAPKIRIGKVTLQGGTVDFADRKIKPNYSAEMLNLGGSITGLSSDEITRAAVDLRGNLGVGSPIEITGKINPLIKDLYADMKLRFKDIELSPTTPYSSKYVGYPILKGKLTFDVGYLIEKRKLDARNKIFIDQLTFGERVESPDAIKAPVPLAVSLLTDRSGQINLDIPISGSLDDPQFQVWPLIWKILGNIIVKAVTAPFTLLASLIGGGEELSYVEFDYGSGLITDSNRNKIQSLAKALYERPNLKMEIMGFVDPEKDKEGLRQAEMTRQIKARKLNELVRKGSSETALDQVRIEPQEYEKYLKLAYEAGKFPKPRTALGMLKTLPEAEMEKLILSHVEVTSSDLRLLASGRAEGVKELILKSGQVAPGRIFMMEPSSSAGKKEKVKQSRVEFKLK